MYKLLIAFMLLVGIKSNAQEKKGNLFTIHPKGWTTEVARLKAGSDTLEVFYGKIKFIKIGDDVFEIVSPSLKRVEPLLQLPIYKQFWPNNVQPAFNTRTENL